VKLAAALGFLLLDLYVYHFFATRPVIPPRAAFAAFPLEQGEWACGQVERMGDDVERNLGVTDYHLCDWTRRRDGVDAPDAIANVYVGYHATQVREEGGGSGENAIHPPAHCLPGSGWDIIASTTARLDLPGLPGGASPVKRLVIANGTARQLVYYWYQGNGRVISADWQKILYVGLDRATRGRTDAALVRFTVPILGGDEAAAEAIFQDLAPRIVAELPAYVPD
jgi:EpsI family protein